jgi:hypothetical protein
MIRIARLVLVLVALVTSAATRAQDVNRGGQIFQNECRACHGPASANVYGIVTIGANNPAEILVRWQTVPAMNYLATRYNAQDRADVAAYLGTFLSAEIRASATQLGFGPQGVGTQSAAKSVTISNFNGTVMIGAITNNDAAEFPIVTNTCVGAILGAGASCRIDVAFAPAALGPRGATISIANNGVVTPLQFTAIGSGTSSAPAADYQGLWWGGPSEDGWGINMSHQGDLIYMTWYTYDATGKPSWLGMLASKGAPGVYSGSIFEVHGSPYDANPYDPLAKNSQTVGSGTLTFTDVANGTFQFTAKGVTRNVGITRYLLGTPPTCAQTSAPNFAAATNYQDLWWNPAEDGWGINFAHQGSLIYATWYTYDHDRSPLWLASLMTPSGNTWTGALIRVTGAPFGPTYDPTKKDSTPVGTATLTLTDGNSATWSYTITGAPGQKSITRFTFASPPTLCQ